MREPAVFWSNVAHGSRCWVWLRAYDRGGYGKLAWRGKGTNAHRVAYELAVGPIPEGLVIDHLCGNRLCVRPDHLEAVTQRVNLLRGNTISATCAAKTHCPQGHPYDAENTYLYRGSRQCLTCRRARARLQRAAA